MRKILLTICICLLVVLLIAGCQSVRVDGFSVGVIYLNTDLTNNNRFTGEQSTRVEGVMPTALLNFKFE